MNLTEIANAVCSDNRPFGHEGMSNRERFHYICEVFECGSIRISDQFDYDLAVSSNDCEIISAALHLSVLQHEWSTRAHMAGHFDDEQHEVALTYLSLARMKMRWAYSFLRFGKEPPPAPFLN